MSLSTSVFDQTPGGGRLGARRAELHQPFLARDVHLGELLQSRPQPFQLPPAHRALLADAVGALGEDIEFVVLGEQLDLDAFARLAPRLVDEMLFETGQAAFGRSHQIVHRRIGWRASRREPPRSERRDPSPRRAAPCRTGSRSWRGTRAASCSRRCCRAGPHRRAAGPPGVTTRAMTSCGQSGRLSRL